MKMTITENKKFFSMIIENNGRPKEKDLISTFGAVKGNELSRQLNFANFAVYTDKQLVNMAKLALAKIA